MRGIIELNNSDVNQELDNVSGGGLINDLGSTVETAFGEVVSFGEQVIDFATP